MSSKKVPPIPPSTRLAMKVPVIIGELEEDGVKYYIAQNGKRWQADIYDRVFVPMKLKVLSRFKPDGTLNLSREFPTRKRGGK